MKIKIRQVNSKEKNYLFVAIMVLLSEQYLISVNAIVDRWAKKVE